MNARPIAPRRSALLGHTAGASLHRFDLSSSARQEAVGAVHLGCLFIDEGFGTLDPDTLRTVADAIRNLQVAGRMVGIITHIPELRDEFDQRVFVEREAGRSLLRVSGRMSFASGKTTWFGTAQRIR
jgi:exonuclease SbcC